MKKIIFILIFIISIGFTYSQNVNLSSEWIKKNVFKIESSNSDFSDLQFLKTEIGDKRIVGLGELSHQGGAIYEERARIVEFLMEEMNFNVVLFESGMFDVDFARKLVKETKNIDSLERSLYKFWRVNEAKDLYFYLQKRIDEDKSTEFAGYDSRFTSKYGVYKNNYSKSFTRVFEENDSTILNENEFKEYLTIWRDIEYGFENRLLGQTRYKMSKKEKENFTTLSEWISNKMIEIKQPKWSTIVQSVDGEVISKTEFSLMKFIFNKKSLLSMLYDREKIMAQNMLYLVNKEYKDKKIIMIGSVFHFLRNNDKIEPVEYEGIPLHETPVMVNIIYPQIKKDLFVIGFTTYQGKYGIINEGEKAYQVVPPLENSIEYQLAKTNYDKAYVSLSDISEEKFWNNNPSIRVVDYKTDVHSNYWDDILDGLIFIKTMKPATYKKR